MGRVYVAGVGLTKVAEHWDRGLEQLMAEAAVKALGDAGVTGVDSIYVGNMAGEALQEQAHLGALVAEAIGMSGVPAFRVEAAGASGAAALYSAATEIMAGRADAVLVVGGEKLSDGLAEEVTSVLLMGERQDYVGYIGATFLALNALLYQLYLQRYDASEEEIAMFPVISHEHAAGVQHAQYPFKISLEKVLGSPYVAQPLRRLETSGIGDGAAAVVLVGEELAGKLDAPKTELYVAAATDYLTPFEREDPLVFPALTRASHEALKLAEVGRDAVNLLELHDATSIMAAVSLESAGFAERGDAGKLAARGELGLSGSLPCNTFGGLKARGHPIGATGLYQVAELHLQLTDQAGKNQVDSPKVGMAQSLGGLGSTAVVTVLKRVGGR